MQTPDFPSLREDLTDAPLHTQVRDLLKALVEAGVRPRDVVDAALTTSTALMVDVEGIPRTGLHLMQLASTLVSLSPELAQYAKHNIDAAQKARTYLDERDIAAARGRRTDH